MSHPRPCANCGGEDHPWPERAPYLRGCIEELKRQIDELRPRRNTQRGLMSKPVVADAEVDMKQGLVPVIFGGLDAVVIVIPIGPLSGVHLKIEECLHYAYSRIGEVQCDLCHERCRFMSYGRVFSFPCTLTGWLFFEPSEPSEGKPLTCRVRCPKCLEKLESYVFSLF